LSAFTRYLTRFFQGKYANLDSNVISFGPCQTPTLALCVKRHDTILSFAPEPFYNIEATIRLNGAVMSLVSTRERLFQKKKAFDVLESLKNSKTLVQVVLLLFKKKSILIFFLLNSIQKVISEKKSTSRPHALNTVEMLKIASSKLGISPQQTMHIAERLYIQGYISYPRTETSKYPPSFDLKQVLLQQKECSYWGQFAVEVLASDFKRPEGGTDVGDHPPITPMQAAREGELAGDYWRLYEYICRHFIATLLPNAHYLKSTVTFSTKHEGGETFTLSTTQLIKPGFTSVLSRSETSQETLPYDLKEGDTVEVVGFRVKEGQTSPPAYLTESDLIGLVSQRIIFFTIKNSFLQIDGKTRNRNRCFYGCSYT
jgi:DNA topoisomerase-3